MLEQAKRPASTPRRPSSASGPDGAIRRPMDREVDPFESDAGAQRGETLTESLERPGQANMPRGEAGGGEDSAEVQAERIGRKLAGGFPNGLGAESGALDSLIQAQAEGALGIDLDGVHITRDRERVTSSAPGAVAMATDNEVTLDPNRVDTHTFDGRVTLGHELTHVAQQRAHRVRTRQPRIPAKAPAPEPSSEVKYPTGEGGAPGFVDPETGQGGGRGQGGAGSISLASLTEDQKIDAIRDMLGNPGATKAAPGGTPEQSPSDTGSGGSPGSTPVPYKPKHAASAYRVPGIATIWESFGPGIYRVAKSHPDLWDRSQEHLHKLPQVVALEEPFAAAAVAEARARMERGKLIIMEELRSLGVSDETLECSENQARMTPDPLESKEPPESEVPTEEAVNDKLDEVADALKALEQLQELRDSLRKVDVYTTEQILAGIQGAGGGQSFEQFDPDSPHADHAPAPSTSAANAPEAPTPTLDIDNMKGPNGFPFFVEIIDDPNTPDTKGDGRPPKDSGSDQVPDVSPETQNWSSTKKVWDALTDAIDAVRNEFPQASVIAATGKSKAFVAASSSDRLKLAKAALLTTLKNIDRTLPSITSTWAQFEQVTKHLLSGKGGSRDWSEPVAELAGKLAIRRSKTPLAHAAAEAGPVGAADYVLPIADAASLVDSAVTLWTKGAEIDAAKKAGVTPDTSLTKVGTTATWLQLVKSAVLLAIAIFPGGKIAQLGYRLRAYIAITGAAKRATKIGTKAAWRTEARALGFASAEELKAAHWLVKNPFRWRAHHAIPQQLQGESLLELGTKLGVWDIHSVTNIVPLPYYYATRRTLMREFGVRLPVHRGSHPWYTSLVNVELKRLYRKLEREAKDAGYGTVKAFVETDAGRARVGGMCDDATNFARDLASGWPRTSIGKR